MRSHNWNLGYIIQSLYYFLYKTRIKYIIRIFVETFDSSTTVQLHLVDGQLDIQGGFKRHLSTRQKGCGREVTLWVLWQKGLFTEHKGGEICLPPPFNTQLSWHSSSSPSQDYCQLHSSLASQRSKSVILLSQVGSLKTVKSLLMV